MVAKGKWMVELKTGEAGGPYKLEIVNGNHKICFKDVFVGAPAAGGHPAGR